MIDDPTWSDLSEVRARLSPHYDVHFSQPSEAGQGVHPCIQMVDFLWLFLITGGQSRSDAVRILEPSKDDLEASQGRLTSLDY
ncbi:hypothetical protein PoB_001456100 [Plakobranchus ocellatus]|uniref:Uncharacterized protein n=1 Tax=Plakobranchus ocellatus TaxID=259542 RepID=A0AAV3YL90_9GAST|nr:hypothetical protein PoB_001456100 [Plakobranchus ocellatus]